MLQPEQPPTDKKSFDALVKRLDLKNRQMPCIFTRRQTSWHVILFEVHASDGCPSCSLGNALVVNQRRKNSDGVSVWISTSNQNQRHHENCSESTIIT